MRSKDQSSDPSNIFNTWHCEKGTLLVRFSTESPWKLQFSIHPPPSGRNHTQSHYCAFTVPALDTLQTSANWPTDLQCSNDLFSWPKHNFWALARMGVWLLKVGLCSYHDEDHSFDTRYSVTYLDSTQMASAFSPAVTVLAARCIPRSISACPSSERILQSFLLNPPQNHFHTLKGCIALFI